MYPNYKLIVMKSFILLIWDRKTTVINKSDITKIKLTKVFGSTINLIINFSTYGFMGRKVILKYPYIGTKNKHVNDLTLGEFHTN